jgi:hypothetical protein
VYIHGDLYTLDAANAHEYRYRRRSDGRALELLVRMRAQQTLRSLRGKIEWEGDLDAMRRDK